MLSVYLLCFLKAYETCPGHYGFSSLFFLDSKNVGVVIEASLDEIGSGSCNMKLERFRIKGVWIGVFSMFSLVLEPYESADF